ncbi:MULTISPECIES: hypothetical protein [Crateriforma]|uniref:Cytochrome oxidase complex assembly protein 1 n=1 Tax=Crateriforma conspicua TaxID=2527996 RepID=A0A5C5XW05_9PLAN|nr:MULTISPECIES: hypothetical protein [Crateriforma]QDV60967.1 hypothetical protein Mal65_00880 [Crateriforma conspicua]TWT65802.1 hypothetical protein Pan14r_53520 [Crateriforma conspicua]
MSNAPNDPFGNQNPGAGYQQPPAKKSNTWLWVLGILAALLLVGALACCGGGYFFASKFTEFAGMAIVEQLSDNPVIQDNVGDIESASINLQETAQYAQDNPGENRMIVDIVGSKSDAQLAIEQQGEDVASAELIMPDGTTYDVPLEGTGFDTDMGDIDAGDLEMGEDDFSIEVETDAP